jgi:hypothetical protein
VGKGEGTKQKGAARGTERDTERDTHALKQRGHKQHNHRNQRHITCVRPGWGWPNRSAAPLRPRDNITNTILPLAPGANEIWLREWRIHVHHVISHIAALRAFDSAAALLCWSSAFGPALCVR